MASKKKTLAADVKNVTSVTEHPEYANELAPEAVARDSLCAGT